MITRLSGTPLTDTLLRLKWEHPDDDSISGFEVERRPGPEAAWETRGVVERYERSYDDDTPAGGIWQYRVRPVEGDWIERHIRAYRVPSWVEAVMILFKACFGDVDHFPGIAGQFEDCYLEYPVHRQLMDVGPGWTERQFKNARLPYLGIFTLGESSQEAGGIPAGEWSTLADTSDAVIMMTYVFAHSDKEIADAAVEGFRQRFQTVWACQFRYGVEGIAELLETPQDDLLTTPPLVQSHPPINTIGFGNRLRYRLIPEVDEAGHGLYWGRLDILIPVQVWLGPFDCALSPLVQAIEVTVYYTDPQETAAGKRVYLCETGDGTNRIIAMQLTDDDGQTTFDAYVRANTDYRLIVVSGDLDDPYTIDFAVDFELGFADARVAPGEVTELDIFIVRGYTIALSGMVETGFGDPVVGLRVYAYQVLPDPDTRLLILGQTISRTDGSYQFDALRVDPGERVGTVALGTAPNAVNFIDPDMDSVCALSAETYRITDDNMQFDDVLLLVSAVRASVELETAQGHALLSVFDESANGTAGIDFEREAAAGQAAITAMEEDV